MVQVRTDYRVGVEDETEKGISSIRKALGGLDKAFAGIGAGLSLAGIGAFTLKAAKAADDINKLSDRLGVSTEALSEFTFVAQQSGLEFKTFATAFQRAIRRVSDAAEGTGPAVDAFKELGLNAKELTKLKPDQVFEVLAEALSQVDDEFKRVSLAQKVFDSEGVALLQTMTEGAQGVRDLRNEFVGLGGTIDQATADVGSDLVDAFGRFKASSNSLGNDLLRILGPALTDVINAMGRLIPQAITFSLRAFEGLRSVIAGLLRDIAGFVGLEEIARSFDNVSKDARDNVIELRDAMEGFGKASGDATNAADFLDKSLGNFAPTAKEAAAAAKQLAKEQRELAAASKEFADAFAEANTKIEGQEAALLSVATPLEEFNILVARFRREQEDLGISAEVTARRVTAAYERITEGVKGEVETVKTETEKLLESINTEIDSFSNNIVGILLDTSNSIGDIFIGLGKQILTTLTKSLIGDPFSKLIKGTLGKFAGGFATGGFIPAGQFGVVGERGPELAFGGRSGQTITPNGGGANVVINNFSESQVDEPVVSRVDGEQQIQLTIRNSVGASVASGSMRSLGFAPPLTRR